MEDGKVTRMGKFIRKTKIDELLQLINILLGDMSFVGPRPDVPGYCDQLMGAVR
jgi:lipopolysaccharide/colanic/teichoic acid biosynthesis glycosyltransferase